MKNKTVSAMVVAMGLFAVQNSMAYSNAIPIQSEQQRAELPCFLMDTLSREVMLLRQMQSPQNNVLKALQKSNAFNDPDTNKFNEIVRILVLSAFNEPVQTTEELQKNSVDQFVRTMGSGCRKKK